ncbi:MAG: hypothetical protein KME30_29040 [Iphinoe sp. HA4291-MV1]|jgi:hypothetical protein|nr:hypothetical protein [Iphinoe sp. HA4291-MV1]
MNPNHKLIAVIAASAVGGISIGYFSTQYLGRDASIAFGGGLFALGVGLQALDMNKQRQP